MIQSWHFHVYISDNGNQACLKMPNNSLQAAVFYTNDITPYISNNQSELSF